MKPGSDLDALIAEKVMGWEIWRHENIDETDVILDDETFSLNEFKPSSDIKDAWEVVDKLTNDGFQFHIIRMNKITSIEIRKAANFDYAGGETSESAPLAICLSALRAVGVEIND